jgi:hypothetical protein
LASFTPSSKTTTLLHPFLHSVFTSSLSSLRRAFLNGTFLLGPLPALGSLGFALPGFPPRRSFRCTSLG